MVEKGRTVYVREKDYLKSYTLKINVSAIKWRLLNLKETNSMWFLDTSSSKTMESCPFTNEALLKRENNLFIFKRSAFGYDGDSLELKEWTLSRINPFDSVIDFYKAEYDSYLACSNSNYPFRISLDNEEKYFIPLSTERSGYYHRPIINVTRLAYLIHALSNGYTKVLYDASDEEIRQLLQYFELKPNCYNVPIYTSKSTEMASNINTNAVDYYKPIETAAELDTPFYQRVLNIKLK